MQVVDSEGYLKVKLVGGPAGPFVPYTGATANVDLGEYEIKVGQVEFDQTPTGTAGVAVMRWNDQDGTVDLGLKGGNVTLQVGQEQVTRVVNKTGSNLLEANYQAVRVDGAQGNRLKVALAQADNDANSADTLGLVTETINNNQEGFVTTSGLVRNIDTTGTLQGETWADGNVLYLSGTTAGQITNIKPAAPIHTVIIGYVVRAHATQGQIYVKVDNGYELDELHNVAIASPTNDQVLQYESATQLWKNKTISTGITIGTTAIISGTVGRVLFQGTGNVVQESANLFWDNANIRLGIGTSAPSSTIEVVGTAKVTTLLPTTGGFTGSVGTSAVPFANMYAVNYNSPGNATLIASQSTYLGAGNTFGFALFQSTRNVLIQNGGTFTDAGFRLDVNGTARVSGTVTLNNTSGTNRSTDLRTSNSIDNFPTTTFYPSSGTNVGQSFQVIPRGTGFSAGIKAQFALSGTDTIADGTNFEAMVVRATGSAFTFSSGKGGTGTIRPMLFSSGFLDGVTNPNQLWLYTTGNVGINTTTDAGFRLDVNGTARVQSTLTVSGGGAVIAGQLQANGGLKAVVILNNTFNTNGNSATIFQSSDALGEARFYNSVCAGFVSTINASAILQAESTTKGFLPPRMTTTQKNAIASPAKGLQIFDTTLNRPCFYDGTTWITL